jgi:HK97 family phage portal protein
MGLFTRSIRPELPNDNTAEEATPGTVGPPSTVPGDPHGVTLTDSPPPTPPIRLSSPAAWSGWPSGWDTSWTMGMSPDLTDTAWTCLDLNSSVLSSMPPYLVNAAPSLQADWLRNPDPNVYTDWQEFAKQLFWDYQCVGEVFVLATARYATGWPARFHVVPPWGVEVDFRNGTRSYTIGGADVTQDMLHVRYTSSVGNTHGTGPLEAGRYRLVAARVLAQYATNLAAGGGIPTSVLEHPEKLSAEQSQILKDQWVTARLSSIGEPAVLSGGVTWKPTQLNPTDMALLDLSQFNESRIAILLGVPPEMVGLPGGKDSLTYSTTQQIREQHWNVGLRPKAYAVMSAMSEWVLPRGTRVEVNTDQYIQPGPLERAQTYQILSGIVDAQGNPVMTVEQMQAAERLNNSSPEDLASGVLK